MQYRYEATSEKGFVQQLATNILTHGYFFYVQGHVREGKDPREIDKKLLANTELKFRGVKELGGSSRDLRTSTTYDSTDTGFYWRHTANISSKLKKQRIFATYASIRSKPVGIRSG